MDKIYLLALSCIPNIGSIQIKKLLERFENPRNVFDAKMKDLKSMENIGEARARDIFEFKNFERAEQEMAFLEKHDIDLLFYTDSRYPQRLKECCDSPIFLFAKGNMNLNTKKVLSIVGTRSNSSYGKRITEELVYHLKDLKDVLILSGLAFGIDAIAHNSCIMNNVPTVGVLGNGLGTIYPYQHKSLSEKMMENGGVISELFHDAGPDRFNFPRRNRLVAGMADATVVIETGKKGGSVITANLANDYNRDVFAVPGRLTDEKSEGCNLLIEQKKAELYFSPMELVQFMNWGNDLRKKVVSQRSLFHDFDENEFVLVKILEEKDSVSIDEMAGLAKMSQGKLASILLNLELKGIVESLPGKRYTLL